MTDAAQTTREKIHETIKNEIFECKIQPSEVLVVDELGKRFNVSRTPVREALITLVNEGLLEVKHHVGFIVTSINAKEIVETYGLRILLEKEAVRLATRRIAPGDLEQLSLLVRKVGEAHDRHFHAFIAKLSGWEMLADILENLMDKSARAMTLFAYSQGRFKEKNLNEKYDRKRIYDAIAVGDEDEAVRCMELHLREALDFFMKALAEAECLSNIS